MVLVQMPSRAGGCEVEGIASDVAGGRTPGRLVLSNRDGTRRTAAMMITSAIAFPIMNR
jgi:hypothetical protein